LRLREAEGDAPSRRRLEGYLIARACNNFVTPDSISDGWSVYPQGATMNFVRLHRPPQPARPAPDDDLDRLLRLAQEGLYWQGDVEDLLIAIRDDGDLGELARAGGPIISRFERMRIEVRRIRAADLRDYVDALDETFAYHAMLLNCALDLLAVSWRSERLREEQARLGGLGRQGERLARVTREIKALASERA
jgi:hypothetical protein